jgi:chromosome segregation ATPase
MTDINSLSKRDLKMEQLQQEIKNKKKDLDNKIKELNKKKNDNPYLETICGEYNDYYKTIIGQIEKELDALTNLNEYVSTINDKTSKYDRIELEKEIDMLKKELDKYKYKCTN